MILDRKWSPKSTANDPERKIGMAGTQVSGWSCQFYYYYRTSDLKRNFTSQINTWIKTKWKNHSSVNRQHTTFSSRQNAVCSNEFFHRWVKWVDYALEENVLAEQMWSLPLIFHTERSWHILIFCGYFGMIIALSCKSISFDLLWNAMLFIAAK